ncbi:MAG: hypothetical protein QUS07_02565 [Methanothrix sp.]|nr:hypothetical protein [Methanothrix sp.]
MPSDAKVGARPASKFFILLQFESGCIRTTTDKIFSFGKIELQPVQMPLNKNDLILQLSGPKTIYETTNKGRELLNNYDQVKKG